MQLAQSGCTVGMAAVATVGDGCSLGAAAALLAGHGRCQQPRHCHCVDASHKAPHSRPVCARSRRADGFTLHCIDTPSLLDQDNVSDAVRARHASLERGAASQPGNGSGATG